MVIITKLTVSLAYALKKNFYCSQCRTWIYCPEMNEKIKDEQGNMIEKIGTGCLKQDNEGEYFECPGCQTRFYLTD